jgi:hypothetical protein
MSTSISSESKTSKASKNVFTDTVGTTAREGLHQATVVSTSHVGRRKTKYGTKDFQMFVLQVKQTNPESGHWETAEIHQQYHRSLDPKSALVQFLAAFGIKACRGMTVDFDDLVGKRLNVLVTHTTDVHGIVHANIKPIKPKGGVQ